MTTKTRASTSARAASSRSRKNDARGVEDVAGALRTLARNSRDLITDAGDVLERELAMAVTVSERLRDDAVSDALLSEARSVRVQAGLRDSAHRVVDLVADVAGVATVTVVRFGEAMVAQPRTEIDRAASRKEAAGLSA